jgi:predicted ATPase
MLHFIVLTGGPCGGKTTLINQLRQDMTWSKRILALPEAIAIAGGVGIDIREKVFQHLMVSTQLAMQVGLQASITSQEDRLVLCHRGSLDPLAYWLENGWDMEEFFTYTKTSFGSHYTGYTAVINLETAARGAPEAYRRWPDAHRSESPEKAIQLDERLHQVWSNHPHYHRLVNDGCSWKEKSDRAVGILEKFIS